MILAVIDRYDFFQTLCKIHKRVVLGDLLTCSSDCRRADSACEHGTGWVVGGRKEEDVLVDFWRCCVPQKMDVFI